MRILHLGKYYPPASGGIERFTADLAQSQVRTGHDVHVLAHAEPGQWRGGTRTDQGVVVERAGCMGQLLFAPVSPGLPFRLERSVRRFKPDLIHVHVPNAAAFIALASPAARAVPWVVQWHSDVLAASINGHLRWAIRAYAPLENRVLARARRVIVSSQSYLDASPTLALWRDRCEVIPLGIPAAGAVGVAPHWPSAGARLLCVGRLSPYKGHQVLLDALARCPQISALLIGEGPCRGDIERRISELGLSDRVRMLGQVDDPTLLAAYQACDLVCLPSLERSESFGLVLLEAMRASRPVVASAVQGSGMRELVVDGETGLQVPVGDPQALAEGLIALAADPAQRSRMGQAGRHRWQQCFDIAPVTARITDLYQAALG